VKINIRRSLVSPLIIALLWCLPSTAQPPEIDVATRTAATFKQIKEERLTLQQAWDRKVLTPEVLVYAIGDGTLFEPERGPWNPGTEVHTAARLLEQYLPKSVESPNGWNTTAKLRLGQYFSWKIPARGTLFLEAALADFPPPKPGEAPGPFAEVGGILYFMSQHYMNLGEFGKAAETALKVDLYTEIPEHRSNLYLQAARAYSASGEKQKSSATYQKVIACGYGWATGHALSAMATEAFNDGKLEKGRALLKQPITGRNAEQIRVMLHYRLAWSYFITGEWKAARQSANDAIAQYQSLQDPIKFHGLESYTGQAKELIRKIDYWEPKPVRVDPAVLRLSATGKTALHTMFTVKSYRELSLTATSTNPNITLKLVPKPAAMRDHNDTKGVFEMTTIAPAGNYTAEVAIRARELPGKTWRVPVYVTVASPVSEIKRPVLPR